MGRKVNDVLIWSKKSSKKNTKKSKAWKWISMGEIEKERWMDFDKRLGKKRSGGVEESKKIFWVEAMEHSLVDVCV